ncbi:PDZ domain-containing protein [Metabacillus sp. GX 13764]|uniref:SepM family pheromone-processing serine protease n=1 Tax=Metabacillus kandeliae TaxID=2900151 RepID=UPI001E3A852B|nr:SepM family pheromone-processing serine protease [Metabacillus kandeliae]MCD7036676.1 PDZ domain-containing protein [Metabacillus kandeliae]
MKGFFNKNKWRFLTAVLVVLLIIAFIPTPYYLYQPGSAEPLSPIVTVENGKKDEKGKLFLTTVLSTRASNLYILASGFVTPHTQIQKKEDVQGDYTDEEYSRLLTHMMSSSQQNAIAAGLKEAGEKVEIIRKGVFVQSVMKDSNAKKILQLGDVVTAADGHKLPSPIELVTYLKENKKAGDTVQITYQHEGKIKTAPIKLIQLDKTRAGLGIGFDDEFTLKTPKKVDIDAKDIGGPSAGLMFSLEILNQVVPEDLTKGYKIAGTGTIDVNGNVGQIGGIEDKIVAAHNEGAEIFLCPADTLKGDSNTKEVIKAAKEDGYDIKIVPVKNIKEAADFLRKLPPKK